MAADTCRQCSELLAALKLWRIVARPWIDGAIGRSGTVTFVEWNAAITIIDAVIAKVEARDGDVSR